MLDASTQRAPVNLGKLVGRWQFSGSVRVNALRRQIEKMGTSSNGLLRAGYRGIKALGVMRRFVVSPRNRSQTLTGLNYRDQHLQLDTYSCDDRYPELFDHCRQYFADCSRPRILSFGCSTGEEVFTLARYLPRAEILGVDLNPWCLKQCEKKTRSSQLSFVHSLSPEFADAKDFDAIFCMAVFQRTEHRTDYALPDDTGFTFERFEAEVAMLDRKLKPGGLIFLDEYDFTFENTESAARYKPGEFDGNRQLRQRPLFDRENRLVSTEHVAVRCFIKQSE
jgi:SAM-dependent methyltransferase